MSTNRPIWHIDTATAGVPQTAHCQRCGVKWCRPQGDRYADTLPVTARAHRCETGS